MKAPMEQSTHGSAGMLSRVMAVVLTHKRPKLATQVVTDLLEHEGLTDDQVLLVINGDGGLTNGELEKRITTLRLPDNLGPAGGFAAGIRHVLDTGASWIYLCEDDASLLSLPRGRLSELVRAAEQLNEDRPRQPVGAIVTFDFLVDLRSGRTSRLRPSSTPPRFWDVMFSAWGATLLSSSVPRLGILPDAALFWGAEDMDFFLRMKGAGFRVVFDIEAAEARRRVQALRRQGEMRPERAQEPWCSYYVARNQLRLRRKYGTWRWTVLHLAKSIRRFQLAPSWEHREAIVWGVWDGLLGRSGKNPRFVREVGEW